jgi:hypothetical protein
MGDGGQLRDQAGRGAMLLDGHGVMLGVEKASSTSREGRGVMLRRQDDGGTMPLKPTTVRRRTQCVVEVDDARRRLLVA